MEYLTKSINDFNVNEYNNIFNKIRLNKKVKIDLLVSTNDKYRSILGEYLLITLINKVYQLDYQKLNVNNNNFGKPYITNMPNIHYSISHSNEYVTCAVSDNEIGIDIEKIRDFDIKLVYKYFNENEIEQILDSNKLNEFFFTFWVLKESYFKMLGTNLEDLKSISFTIKRNKILSNINDVVFKLIRVNKDYIVAICEKTN